MTNRLTLLKKINSFCECFEDQWLRENDPRIEDFLESNDSNNNHELLAELIRIEIFYLNEMEKVVDINDYHRRFPEMTNDVIRAFDSIRQTHDLEASDIAPKPAFQPRTIGSRIGLFELEQRIGQGAFAEVFLAFDREQNRPVAIKAMKRITDDDGQPEPRAIQSFVEEARTLSKLKNSAVGEVYDLAYDIAGFPFVVMEFIKGDSLAFLLREQIIDLPTGVKILADTAEALSKVHQQGVFHRDLKPENVIVGLDGKPRIIDFGLAVGEDEQRERQGEIAGSVAYMSPELLRGQTHRIDGRSDIWSLGIMLYEILTGRLPFQGSTRQLLIDEILNRNPRPIRQINTNVPPGLEEACFSALQKDSTKRTPMSMPAGSELMVTEPSVGNNAIPMLTTLFTLRTTSVEPVPATVKSMLPKRNESVKNESSCN